MTLDRSGREFQIPWMSIHPHQDIWIKNHFDDPDHVLQYIATHAPLLSFGRYGSSESCLADVVTTRLVSKRSILPAQVEALSSSKSDPKKTLSISAAEEFKIGHNIAVAISYSLGVTFDVRKSQQYEGILEVVSSWGQLRKLLYLRLLECPYGISSNDLFKGVYGGATESASAVHARWVEYFYRLNDSVELPSSIRHDIDIHKVMIDDDGVCCIVLPDQNESLIWLIHQSKLSTSTSSPKVPASVDFDRPTSHMFDTLDMSTASEKILRSVESSRPHFAMKCDSSQILNALVDLWMKAKYNTACVNFRRSINSTHGRMVIEEFCNCKLGGEGEHYAQVQNLISVANDVSTSLPLDPVWFAVTFDILGYIDAFVTSKTRTPSSKYLLTLWYFRMMHHATIVSKNTLSTIKSSRSRNRVGKEERK